MKEKDEKALAKWLKLIVVWIIILIVTIILAENKMLIFGLWLLVTGIIMASYSKHYKAWYIRMYGSENPEKENK